MSDIKHRITKLEQSGSKAEDIKIFDPLNDNTFRQAITGKIFTAEELHQIKGHILIWDMPIPINEVDAGELETKSYGKS